MQLDSARRMFRYLNKYFMVPAFRLGLGAFIVNPLTGYIMVMKTIGHKTGKVRYSPMDYAIQNGNVYCIAGWGQTTHWYRNLLATPRVELLMPGGTLTGIAEQVTDPDERLSALRQILKNGGLAGFFFGFNPYLTSDHTLAERCATIPVVRIRPASVRSGPADPGGWLWLLWVGVTVLPAVMRWFGKKRRCC